MSSQHRPRPARSRGRARRSGDSPAASSSSSVKNLHRLDARAQVPPELGDVGGAGEAPRHADDRDPGAQILIFGRVAHRSAAPRDAARTHRAHARPSSAPSTPTHLEPPRHKRIIHIHVPPTQGTGEGATALPTARSFRMGRRSERRELPDFPLPHGLATVSPTHPPVLSTERIIATRQAGPRARPRVRRARGRRRP